MCTCSLYPVQRGPGKAAWWNLMVCDWRGTCMYVQREGFSGRGAIRRNRLTSIAALELSLWCPPTGRVPYVLEQQVHEMISVAVRTAVYGHTSAALWRKAGHRLTYFRESMSNLVLLQTIGCATKAWQHLLVRKFWGPVSMRLVHGRLIVATMDTMNKIITISWTIVHSQLWFTSHFYAFCVGDIILDGAWIRSLRLKSKPFQILLNIK